MRVVETIGRVAPMFRGMTLQQLSGKANEIELRVLRSYTGVEAWLTIKQQKSCESIRQQGSKAFFSVASRPPQRGPTDRLIRQRDHALLL